MDKAYAQFQREQLHAAAQKGDLEKVEKLLKAKYPVNRFDELGQTPLHYAVAGEHFAIVEALLRAGAKVNAQDERVAGDTPLADCAETCSLKMAQRLIRAGADPMIPGCMGLNAIHRAERRRSAEGKKVLELLQAVANRHGK
jgi:ankyrin repeat protein